MKLFSVTRTLASLTIALASFAASVSAQVPVSVVGNSNAACANASVTFSSTGIAITLPAGCGGAAATAPTITAATPPSGTTGAAYTYTFAANGTAPISWSVASGTLPAGLALASNGVLSGTPTAAGTSTFTVQAANGTAPNATQSVSVTIAAPSGPPVITSGVPPASGAVGQAYSFSFTATGLQPITWAMLTGNFPAGTTLNPTTGQLSGTLTTGGTYNFAVSATNAGGAGGANVTVNSGIYTVTVSAPSAPTISAASPPTTATVGTAYTAYTFIAAGTPTPTWTVASGALPPGLSLSSAGVLSGTPTTAGAATFAVKAANGTLPDAVSANITITVSGGVACAPGNLSTDGFCMVDPSRSPSKVVLATEPGRLSGPPAPFSPLGAYSAEVATSCAASNAQLGANQGVTTRWQHNVDWVAYRKGQTLEEFGIPPRHAITYRFVASNDIALPPTGEIQLAGGNSYPGSVGTLLSLSTTPCDFDVTMTMAGAPFSKKFCYSNNSSLRFEVTSGAGTLGYCKLTPGTTYYFNLRSVDTTNLVESCSNAVCGGIFQIR